MYQTVALAALACFAAITSCSKQETFCQPFPDPKLPIQQQIAYLDREIKSLTDQKEEYEGEELWASREAERIQFFDYLEYKERIQDEARYHRLAQAVNDEIVILQQRKAELQKKL